MNYNVLFELSNKLNLDPYEIKKYHYIFKDLDIIPGSVSVIVEPEIIIRKIPYVVTAGTTKPINQTLKDGYAIAKQKNGNNVLIKLRCCEPKWEEEKLHNKDKGSKKAEKVLVEYALFLSDEGMYYIHNYNLNRQGDTIEFSYFDNEACDVVLGSDRKLDMTTLSRFSAKGIASDYDGKAKTEDIMNDGGFLSYASKIDKKEGKNKGTV